MNRSWSACSGLIPLALLLACNDSTAPEAPNSGTLATSGGGGCPNQLDFVVHNESGFRDAIVRSRPGQVIGIDGTIGLVADVYVRKDSIRITCATAGSGLHAAGSVGDMLVVAARGVQVDHLMLDGYDAFSTAFSAFNDGVSFFARDLTFTHNAVTCATTGVTGAGACMVVAGGDGVLIADNYFESWGTFTGVHLQTSGGGLVQVTIDRARVERNTILAASAGTDPRFGGIRLFAATNSKVVGNQIVGPWANGISLTGGANVLLEGNRIESALGYGLRLAPVNLAVVPVVSRGYDVRQNRIRASALGGAYLSFACHNSFTRNDLSGNAGELGILLDVNTGANDVRGESATGVLVEDRGAFDCDGDGRVDPNLTDPALDMAPRRVAPPAVSAAERGEQRTASGALVM